MSSCRGLRDDQINLRMPEIILNGGRYCHKLQPISKSGMGLIRGDRTKTRNGLGNGSKNRLIKLKLQVVEKANVHASFSSRASVCG